MPALLSWLAQVFKAAKALAPSVVYIDEAEKVFVSDKARAKQLGGKEPFSRIKKQLVAEASRCMELC